MQADRIGKVVSTKSDEILCQRIRTPRPPPKMVLKEAWQVQREEELQQQRGIEKSIAGQENPFKIDFRLQGVPYSYTYQDPKVCALSKLIPSRSH